MLLIILWRCLLTYSKAFTVNVTNVNEAPTNLTLSANTIAENAVIGTGVKIGDVTITDPDTTGNNNVLTVEGTDGANFEIRNSTELYFKGTSPDFESKPSYSITLKSTDGALTYSKAFTVNVTNVNEAPTDLTLSANTIAENTVIGTGIKIGDITITDLDTTGNNNVLTVEGTDAANFEIRNGTELYFKGTSPDFENQPSYSLNLKSTDGALTYSKAFTVNVSNVNEAPTDLSLSANAIAENTVIGTGIKIGDITITDPDTTGNNNVLTVEGTDAANFEIRNGTELYFKGTSPDFENQPSYSINLKSTDGALTYSKAFTIGVTDVKEAPTNLTLSANTITSNAVIGTGIKIGDITITDPDATGNNNVLSIEGTDAANFEIRNTNQLYFIGVNPNYQTKPSYSINLKSTDANSGNPLNYSKPFTVDVINPVTPSGYNASVAQNAPTALDLSNLLTGSGTYTILSQSDGSPTPATGYTLTGKILTVNTANIGNVPLVIINGSQSIVFVVNVFSPTPFQYTLTSSNDLMDISGSSGAAVLNGLAGADSLTSGAGNDILDGGSGNDKLTAGNGNDTYIIDSTSDVITETAVVGSGIDSVYFYNATATGYTLPTNVENLYLLGNNNFNGTGNASKNILVGNTGNNVLSGLTENDTLIGGAGNDSLNGGTGIDSLIGGAGNDIYVVDNSADVIVEALNEGTDLVQSSVTYALSSNLENLTLTGSAAINGTGNTLANQITGNTGINILDDGGVGGIDTLIGGSGNDTYIIQNAGAVITDSAGVDTVQTGTAIASYTLGSTLENLTLTNATTGTGNSLNNLLNASGNANGILLSGLGGNDTLTGSNFNDTLVGGVGKDTLNAGAGVNTFDYTVLTDSLLSNYDVTDFEETAGDKFKAVVNTNNIIVIGTMLTSLSATTIQAVLTASTFKAFGVGTFSVMGVGNFVAINDSTAGFNPLTDALIKVSDSSGIGAANFMMPF